MIAYIILFIVFSVIGWVIDSAYRSIVDKKWSSGYLVPLFAPIYGFGGLSLVLIFKYVQVHPMIQILLGTIALVIIEFIGGILNLYLLKRRLWDYRKNRYNILGHVDLKHSFYWLILSIIMRIVFGYMF